MNEYFLLEKRLILIGILLFFMIGVFLGICISDWMLIVRGIR